jgi:hypothetical protein
MALRVPDVANAAYDALVADTTLTTALGGAKVYAYVPEDTTSPYVQVLGGREAPWATEAGADDSSRTVDVDVDIWSTYRGTKEPDDLGARVHTVLMLDASWASVTGYAGVLFQESPRPITEFIEGRVWTRRRVTVRVYIGRS